MAKNRKHSAEFRLQVVREHQQGHSIRSLSKTWNLSPSLVTKWIDHHDISGAKGLLPKRYLYYTKEFKLKVVKAYKDKGLSLRSCCLQFNIPTQSTIVSWARQYEQLGLDGLREQKGRPTTMNKDKPVSKKKAEPLTRLQELERENLYLRAENDFLKKLDALTQEKQTQQKKKH
jgi:transposase